MTKRDHARGASKSLNKSITELEDYLVNKTRPIASGPLRQELHDEIARFAIHWFRRGFRRGCMEAHSAWDVSGSFPAKVRYEAARTFYATGKQPVKMAWTMPVKKAKPKASRVRKVQQ